MQLLLEEIQVLSDNTRMNFVKILNKLGLVLAIGGLGSASFAAKPATQPIMAIPAPDLTGQALYDTKHWSLMYYYANTVNAALVGTFIGNYKEWPEHIQSLELAYTLDQNNRFRQFFHPIVNVVQLAANATVRQGVNDHTIYEFNPYIIFRWANYPWNHYVNTSLALAEGVSYDSSVSYMERRGNDNFKRLINYLMFELTLSAPSKPDLQLVLRVHHRSGAYGLYQADNTGSNDIGIGIRYFL